MSSLLFRINMPDQLTPLITENYIVKISAGEYKTILQLFWININKLSTYIHFWSNANYSYILFVSLKL